MFVSAGQVSSEVKHYLIVYSCIGIANSVSIVYGWNLMTAPTFLLTSIILFLDDIYIRSYSHIFVYHWCKERTGKYVKWNSI